MKKRVALCKYTAPRFTSISSSCPEFLFRTQRLETLSSPIGQSALLRVVVLNKHFFCLALVSLVTVDSRQ